MSGAATAAMVAWGFSGVLIVLTKEPGLVVALERLLLGVPLVGALLALTQRRLDWSTFWRTVPGGVLLCGDMAMFFSAVKLTSIADATVIGALQPALVLFVAGPLFGEKPVRADVVWTAVAIAGVGVVMLGTGGTGSHQVLGDLLAFGSLCSWTGYWLVSKQARLVPRATPGDGPSQHSQPAGDRHHRVHVGRNACRRRGHGAGHTDLRTTPHRRDASRLALDRRDDVGARERAPGVELGAPLRRRHRVLCHRVGQPGCGGRGRGRLPAPIAQPPANYRRPGGHSGRRCRGAPSGAR